MKYRYEIIVNGKVVGAITGDIYDAERTADEIPEDLGISVDDLIIGVTARYKEVSNNDRSY